MQNVNSYIRDLFEFVNNWGFVIDYYSAYLLWKITSKLYNVDNIGRFVNAIFDSVHILTSCSQYGVYLYIV